MEIREASAADWEQIAPFCHRILHEQETYCWDVTADAEAEREFWMGGESSRVTVAVDDGRRVVGTAKMGPNRPGQGSHYATASFMVDPDSGTRGVGTALAHDMIAWARAEGFAGVTFNAVVESNVRAVQLWQRLGFTIVGTVPGGFDSPRHGRVGLHIMQLGFA